MRSLTTLFNTEKNKKFGATPVWILKIPFVSGTIYLSDRSVTITDWALPAITTLPWIAAWGQIDENISGFLDMPIVSDLSVDILVDPDAVTDIHDLLWSEAVETIKCTLYLWFYGLDCDTDPPIPVWSGNIIDFEKIHELLYNVRLVDEGVRVDKNAGEILSLADYSNAYLNHVGYTLPELYGSVERVPALRLSVGAISLLSSAMTQHSFIFNVADAGRFAEDDVVRIDTEEITVTAIDGQEITVRRGDEWDQSEDFSALSQTSRGWAGMCVAPNGNVYAAEYSGDIYMQTAGVGNFAALSQTTRKWYGMAAAPNGDIYAVVGEGTDNVYKQTAGTGNFTSLSLTGRDYRDVCVAPNGDVYVCVYNGDIYMQTGGSGSFNALSQTSRGWNALSADPDGNIYCVDSVGGYVYKRTSGAGNFVSLGGTAHNWSYCGLDASRSGYIYVVDSYPGHRVYVKIGSADYALLADAPTRDYIGLAFHQNGHLYTNVWNGDIYSHGTTTTSHVSGSIVSEIGVSCVYMFANHPVKSIGDIFLINNNLDPVLLTDITALCTKYTGQGGANDLAGYAGKAVVTYTPDYNVGQDLLISGEGYKDDGSGTFTGTASALIERPDHIFKHFLYTHAAWPVADFITDAATPFGADSYKFSVVINTRRELREWLAYMALQCRCWFRFAGGKAYLLYRPDSISSDKTIPSFVSNKDNTTTMRITRSPLDEILNVIHLYYQRDWTKSSGKEAYQAVTRATDATSLAAYGEKEKADTFLFDFVRDATMATDLRDFYLARYKNRKKVISGTLSLDHGEIEFADGVTLTEAGSLLCEVSKAGISPGNANETDKIKLIAREY